MARVGGHRYCYKDVLPFTALVAMECSNVGLNTLFKFATNHGMSRHVFVVYAYAVAALVLLPAMFLCRSRSRVLPQLNFSIMIKTFLLGVIGCASQIMGYTGINYGSPTLASAISNLTPAFTFVLAIIFRMEKLEPSSTSSRAKVVGTLVSISGAFVVTLFKGPSINSPPDKHQILHSSRSNWIIGSLFLTIEYILVPVWYIVLTHIMKEYPAELTLMFFYNLFVSILAAFVGLIAEPDSGKWIIRPNISLASILCSGVFGSGLNNVIHTWALHLRGPVYVAMFKPLSIAIAAAMGVVILGDTLYLGSIIGATIIAIGFYTVMWGKTKEGIAEFDEISDLESVATQKHPLLRSYKTEGTEKR
ncbi:WAT1-related At3g28050-like [Olea europaea subsp. europaea]|uniref:WAT1-related protein n=2 Tax=Olea europaea subsp. europaea TaxID=158383 RepID=A0A8S0SSU7_OLEEU|nr:WAT1-related At3g28050-like [Olea europaea subsp. europaea]